MEDADSDGLEDGGWDECGWDECGWDECDFVDGDLDDGDLDDGDFIELGLPLALRDCSSTMWIPLSRLILINRQTADGTTHTN